MSTHPTSTMALPRNYAAPRSQGTWAFVRDHFLLLPAGALIALLWANLLPESYFRFAHPLSFPVNEIGMTLFLALIAQELLESVLPGGALHTWRRWGLAAAAGVGGFLGAAGMFMLWIRLAQESVLTIAWPVAGAIDIAAGYYVLKTIWPRGSALPFLLLIAVVGDILALIAVAAGTPVFALRPGGVAMAILGIGLAALMKQVRLRSMWPYLLVSGPVVWFGLYLAGLHPALALVLVVPFLPRAPRTATPFVEPPADGEIHRSEHRWNVAAQVVLFLFGLVNAGVLLRGYDTGTWAILGAALIGRPLGILVAVAIGTTLGLGLPRNIGWRGLTVISLATSSGFTFALFLTTSAMAIGPAQSQIKLGTLATVVAALLTVIAARVLRVGRYSAARPVVESASWPIV
jgi:Na+:H+ antiporter, NhaA family